MLVNRNPFARQELHRCNESVVSQSCSWCGNVRKTRGGKFYLYRYRVESDGGRKWEDPHLFCSKGCREAYHG